MAWSTREVAELAGTSLRAVRHYHRIGLLDEPERRANGYKQYGVAHLLRLLRIRRLTELGFSLSRIAAMDDTDDHPEQDLLALDAKLEATIDRLTRARAELAGILHRGLPADLPAELAPAGADLSRDDRSFLTVLARVLSPAYVRTYADALPELATDPVSAELDALPADADEPTRQGLVDRLVPRVRAFFAAHPALADQHVDTPHGHAVAQRTMAEALREIYNPAQVDVLARLSVRLTASGE